MDDATYEAETLAHIARVQECLRELTILLTQRGERHDLSKLVEPERSGFIATLPRLKATPYGTPAYTELLSELRPTIQHHYAVNDHHPEHYPPPMSAVIDVMRQDLADIESSQESKLLVDGITARTMQRLRQQIVWAESGINGMTLLSLLELFCDWKAASERHSSGDFIVSLVHNRVRFGLSDQVYTIFVNTAEALGW
jgi:hypothetical protein